ncbi:hypothetical protein DRN67_02330 [Candidatus Micrarchaeota archaeon]|nr:MAG: hypothetical protein DRN67_02330 [Candidatus Micrarchaeota archaeon]
MVSLEDLMKNVGRIIPKKRMAGLDRMLIYAGLERIPELVMGFMILFALVFGMLLFFIGLQIEATAQYAPLLSLLSLLIFPLAYLYLTLRIDSRRRQVEVVLPDFLQLASANVRAGMPIDQAMWHAARPEFGLLSEEVTAVAKLTFGGEPFAETMDRLGERIESKNLQRTIRLIKQGLVSGGEMADILEETANDIRNGQIIRKEIATALLMYVIFIVFASALGAPFLYGVSYKMLSVLETVWIEIPQLDAGATAGAGGSIGIGSFLTPTPPTISSEDFLIFALVASFLTSFFASVIIAVIQVGSKKHFVRYFPIFIAITAIVFTAIILVLDTVFAGIL